MNPDAARAILLDRIDYNASRFLISARDKAIQVGLRGYVAGLTAPEMVKLAGYLPNNMAEMTTTEDVTVQRDYDKP